MRARKIKRMINPFKVFKTEEESLSNHLEQSVPKALINNFISQAKQKIESEGWGKQGRNVEVKIRNFVQCWITEEAFKQILIQKKKWFRYRGLYFGDAEGAGADFTVRIKGKDTSIGIRSISLESLNKWKSVAYPDDRFRDEKDKIAEYHIVCSQEKGKVKFYGIISKEDLLDTLQKSQRRYSPKNQEWFRIVPLAEFKFEPLVDLINSLNAV